MSCETGRTFGKGIMHSNCATHLGFASVELGLGYYESRETRGGLSQSIQFTIASKYHEWF
jgi:hypothetical protein